MRGQLGEVMEILEETEQIQLMGIQLYHSAEIIKGVHYIVDKHICRTGDKVRVNTSALDLELGTGGYGFVIAIIQEEDKSLVEKNAYPGHIMKLRYTPCQSPVLAVEAPESGAHEQFLSSFSLGGQKVLLGELHSMLPVVVSLLETWDNKRKIAYIMDDQAALYLSFSSHLRSLKQRINVTTITYGQALGGDIETVNLYTALEAAQKMVQADDIIVTQGPGVVGTGTPRGFSGMQLVHWIHTVHTCQGEAVVIPRLQFQDQRERHIGVSHHTLYPLSYHTLSRCTLPYPVSNSLNCPANDILRQQLLPLQTKHELVPVLLEEFIRDLEQALQWYERPILTMGRSYQEEAYFFYAIGAVMHYYKQSIDRK